MTLEFTPSELLQVATQLQSVSTEAKSESNNLTNHQAAAADVVNDTNKSELMETKTTQPTPIVSKKNEDLNHLFNEDFNHLFLKEKIGFEMDACFIRKTRRC